MSYENPWIYLGEIFESDHIQDHFGFVYRIDCVENDRSYWGRKYFWSFRKKKGASRRSKSESDWKKYYGSCPELKEDIKKYGKDKFKRYIISLHDTVGQTNYAETRELFVNNVLIESLGNNIPKYYNSNILGRYYRKDYFNKGMDNPDLKFKSLDKP